MNRNGYGQFGHRTLKLTVSRTDFLHAGAYSQKLKAILMSFGWAWSKNSHGHLIYSTLELAIS